MVRAAFAEAYQLEQVLAHLNLTLQPTAPHGSIEVPGRHRKLGETVILTREQRDAVDDALAGYLTEFEEAYDPQRRETDYQLFPSGVLTCGRAGRRASVRRGKPLARDAAIKMFHALERAAGVEPQHGRGWYGLRRVATDMAPAYTSDNRVLDRLGGWTAGSETRALIYQDREAEEQRARAAEVRRAMRLGMPVTGTPSSPATPATPATDGTVDDLTAALNALPPRLRAAIEAALAAAQASPSVVAKDTQKDTNESAPGTEGSEGAVSR